MGAWEFNCGACRRRGFDVSSPPSFVGPLRSPGQSVGRERRDKGRVDSCVALVAQEPFLLSSVSARKHETQKGFAAVLGRCGLEGGSRFDAAIRSNRPSPLRLLGARCVGPRAVPSVTWWQGTTPNSERAKPA